MANPYQLNLASMCHHIISRTFAALQLKKNQRARLIEKNLPGTQSSNLVSPNNIPLIVYNSEPVRITVKHKPAIEFAIWRSTFNFFDNLGIRSGVLRIWRMIWLTKINIAEKLLNLV